MKNHFTLLGSKDQAKFDRIYGVSTDGTSLPVSGGVPPVESQEAPKKETNISDDEEEDEVVPN